MSEADRTLARALAQMATIGLLQERAIRSSKNASVQLQTALTSRVRLEQAKGMIAERHSVDIDTAFERLRSYARHHHRQISDVALSIVRDNFEISCNRLTPCQGFASLHRDRRSEPRSWRQAPPIAPTTSARVVVEEGGDDRDVSPRCARLRGRSLAGEPRPTDDRPDDGTDDSCEDCGDRDARCRVGRDGGDQRAEDADSDETDQAVCGDATTGRSTTPSPSSSPVGTTLGFVGLTVTAATRELGTD